MDLISNLNILREKFPKIWQSIDIEKTDRSYVNVSVAKNGLPTLSAEVSGQEVFIHSRYNPVQEAERIIDQLVSVDTYDHVFFYGMGMGYHIEAFLKKYPDISYSVYEPNVEVFVCFLENRRLEEVLLFSRLKELYIQNQEDTTGTDLGRLLGIIATQKVLFVSLPSYERIFREHYEQFAQSFKQMVANKTQSVQVNASFEKRWILNSLRNLPKVLETPNILHDIDKSTFTSKPAILVAAGPSLEEDIEFIRHIKENSLAFIFTVGSAINVLLKYNILPDAACTYDPKVSNQLAFQKIVDEGITSVPLIFGSSVGYETITSYPGPMAHMITNQDTVASLFYRLESEEKLQLVEDAPTIAVVTLQLLQKLGCNPIILAGQNLAFREEKRYSSGIDYHKIEVTSQELSQAIIVEDVYGNSIHTNKTFDNMRKVLEAYISRYNGIEIINTTKGGARIKGTSFETIENLISDKLRCYVDTNFLNLKTANSYDRVFLVNRFKEMDKYLTDLQEMLNSLIKILESVESLMKAKRYSELDRTFLKYDKFFRRIEKNPFYKNIIRPMNRVQYENLTQQISQVRFNKDLELKGSRVVEQMRRYLNPCLVDIHDVKNVWKNIISKF